MTDKKYSPVPFRIMAGLILIGLSFSIYLTILHIKVFLQTDYAAASSVCSINEGFNCETVAENSYSVFAAVPVSVWGMVGYLFMLAGAVMGNFKKIRRIAIGWSLAFVGIGCLVSATLGYISITKISSICIFCFGTYIINFSLLGILIWMLLKHKDNPVTLLFDTAKFFLGKIPVTGLIAVIGLGTVGSLIAFYPKYWKTEYKLSTDLSRLSTGKTDEGHWWIGSRNPLVTLTEISDYECPFCAKYHNRMRELVNKYPEKLRLIHKHYPLDQACNPIVTKPFHKSACEKAKIAICAGKLGKFWEANDLLYSNRKKRISAYMAANILKLDARELKKCVAGKEVIKELSNDIREGNEMKLSGTPVYLINGQRERRLSIQMIESMLESMSGKDKNGNYWIGAKDPVIVIHEYSDYECPFCKKYHKAARDIVSKHFKEVRLVHHHFPLDHSCNSLLKKPFHKNACNYSMIAKCAGKQDKFWEANDFIFRHRKSGFSTEDIIKELSLDREKIKKCLHSPEIISELKKEIEEGIDKKLNSTPTFFINDREISPKNLLKEVENLLKK
ncbi:MAG: thioredoxin domain-containing protein [Deltaproteobacteria bacterium]|nr:thioredoxin domain-containing protein [Deltaproteobacteria bacterium]